MRTIDKSAIAALLPLARRKVLAALLPRPGTELHLRELARRTGLAPATIQREVRSLAAAGILERQQVGRQVYYRANERCPLLPELRSLMLKTEGLGYLLRDALEALGDRVEAAAVFGSVADGTATDDSDLDLLVIGEATLTELVGALRPLRPLLGREVNIVATTADRFRADREAGEGFVLSVLSHPLLMIKGVRDDLGRTGPAGAPETTGAGGAGDRRPVRDVGP